MKKQTKGNEKINQIVDDLVRNEEFMTLLKSFDKLQKKLHKKTQEFISSKKPVKQTKEDIELDKVIASYVKAYKRLVHLSFKNRSQENKLYGKLASLYGLVVEREDIFDIIMSNHKNQKASDALLERLRKKEMCNIINVEDEINHERRVHNGWPYFPVETDSEKLRTVDAYPISLGIHKIATRNDILDYVKKNWDKIEEIQSMYRGKKVKIRKRKLDKKLIDFIWNKKYKEFKSSKEICFDLKIAFPEACLSYWEINKIIYQEERRRWGRYEI